MPTLVSRRAMLLSLPGTFLFAANARAGLLSSPVPEDLDLALAKLSAHGFYHATLAPEEMPIPIRKMQTWTVTLRTARGVPLTEAGIMLGGGMPQHGHGLPTRPQATANLGDGRYLIEGVKFNMRGWWVFEVAINGPDGADTVTFNLVL